ncbi:MAG: hypothetical protein EZS28_038625, partial [Streblomastix strix]
IFKKYASKFAKKGCKFISEDPKILTVFQGYKYKKLDTIDYECLQMYFNLIKETIAAGDERVYEYILNWIVLLMQNLGKNLEQQSYFKKGVATVMKSIISDLTIRINEKNQPRRTAENVMNIIYVTNAEIPVQFDTDDRRHLVFACKTVHQVSEEYKEDIEYFNELSQSYTQEFYENLMTFLLERDISQFNPTLVPTTDAKKQLINVSRSPLGDAIIEYYKQFKYGIPVALANQCKPQNWQLKTYKNAMIHMCTEQSQ